MKMIMMVHGYKKINHLFYFCLFFNFQNCLKIRPKQCTNALGENGTCMFVWECIKTEGKHLGTCSDGFLFGSCCGHNDWVNNIMVDNEFNNNNDEIYNNKITTIKTTTTPATPTTTSPTTTTTTSSSLIINNHHKPTTTTIIYTTSQKPWIVYTGRPIVNHTTATTTTTTKRPAIVWPIITITKPIIHHHHQNNNSWNIIKTTTTTPSPNLITSINELSNQISTTTTTDITTVTTTILTITTPKPTTTTTSSQNGKHQQQCGITQLKPRTKVVGGKNSAFGAWPWQVSVRRISFFGFSSTHRCGGALLNNQWIATAGHCVDDLLLTQIRIRVGEYDFSSSREPFPHIERGVRKKIVHPKYNFFTYENDLALVQLDNPIDYLPHISPICLPPDNFNLMGKNATVTGWGRLSEGGILPTVLQEVRVPIISNDKCKNMFLSAGRHEYIPDIFMCAGYDNGGHDSCQGDSGGPLQVQHEDGHWFLAGIISWGIGCGEPSLPGVCTRITKFKQWILSYINE